jgi:hypothetical protein
MILRLLAGVLVAPPVSGSGPGPDLPGTGQVTGCSSSRPRTMLGLLVRPLTLPEMVSELERGCLALEEVRFKPGQDTIETVSPSQFALVARALGMAQGVYRVAVPPEGVPGSAPDTLQARRRSMRLRDELIHYGASLIRLREDPGWPFSSLIAAPGTAIPMLVRVPES